MDPGQPQEETQGWALVISGYCLVIPGYAFPKAASWNGQLPWKVEVKVWSRNNLEKPVIWLTF